MSEKILEVKDLKISFRTSSGVLKAVRDISFDLYRGKTLAIVGESGSGKSVTSKAILGILAGNAIIEGGEVLYDGKDLLRLDEETMHTIRGDKISMIFQDPLSSLNPIVKIGPQITEAMLLKNKSGRKNAKKEFNDELNRLNKAMKAACPSDGAKIDELTKKFNSFCLQANKLEATYNQSDVAARDLVEDVTNFLYMASKDQKQEVKALTKEQMRRLKLIKDEFFVEGFEERLAAVSSKLSSGLGEYHRDKDHPEKVNDSLLQAMEEEKQLLLEMLEQHKPDFFRLGYYKFAHPDVDLHAGDRLEMDEKALEILDAEFMTEFLDYTKKALNYSHGEAVEGKKAAVAALNEAGNYFAGGIDKKKSLALTKELDKVVNGGIDMLETVKDSTAYTFDTSMANSIDMYFHYLINNPKEQKRYDTQTAKRQAAIDKGKTVDWQVVPANILDTDELKHDISKTVSNMAAHYTKQLENDHFDADAKSVELVDYFKDKASKAVSEVTNEMAKQKAISLMEEVGIPEPRMRFNQYPFEFSGGMRQRIVIAIALAANPEILICDEPTTALDVTIQAQILELINKLKAERNLSIIFITHDLGVVAQMADEIAVMYAGKIVEQGTSDEVFYDPKHPYTWALLSSIPDLDTKEKLESIPGTPPNMIYPPKGDAFAARNKYAMEIDFEEEPPMFEVSPTHKAATWLLHPDAPKVDMPDVITARIERMRKKAEQQAEQEVAND